MMASGFQLPTASAIEIQLSVIKCPQSTTYGQNEDGCIIKVALLCKVRVGFSDAVC
jgi:aspartate carbamoyltransferase catalytic subunit